MAAPSGFNEARWAAFLYARRRRMDALERGVAAWLVEAQFREWFVGLDEGETGSYTKEPVAALLGALRLEWGRR